MNSMSCLISSSVIVTASSRLGGTSRPESRHVGQPHGSRCRQRRVILDPRAAPVGEIRARFDREHHARLQWFSGQLGPELRDPGPFVHFQSKTVAGAVAERLAQSRAAPSIRASRDRCRSPAPLAGPPRSPHPAPPRRPPAAGAAVAFAGPIVIVRVRSTAYPWNMPPKSKTTKSPAVKTLSPAR